MKKLKATSEVESFVNKTLADAAAELETINNLLVKEKNDIAEANEAMYAATSAGDLDAYQAAKNARRNAADAKEMHEARLAILNGKALITKIQYDDAVHSIYAEIAAIESEVKKNLADYSFKMNQEAERLKEAAGYANKVLGRLQNDVYRNQDRRRSNDGSVMHLQIETKQVNVWETINWGKKGVEAGQYKDYTKSK